MSSALVGVCVFRRLLRRDVIGVYWEVWCPVEDIVTSSLIPSICNIIREKIDLSCTSSKLESHFAHKTLGLGRTWP